jgi:acetyl esterase/lipase
MSEGTEREAIVREIARKKVAYRLPEMDALPSVRNLTYEAVSGSLLPMDVYYPASLPAGGRAPVVLAPLGYPDPQARVRMYGPLTSWAQLIAASGMAAVLFGAEVPDEDVHAALRHLRGDADALALETNRLGLFAASGNVTVALSVLMRDRRVRCAALLYGCTMDLDGSTTIADMGTQAGFVNACAGKTVDDLPVDVPMLFVRAGRDGFPGLNDALDKVIARALARNLPFTLINHAAGGHGFDLDEDTEMSRGIVQQVLTFLRSHLIPNVPSTNQALGES